MHYRKGLTKACGYAVMYNGFGEWTACEKPAAKE
jgi:hypothetical protein